MLALLIFIILAAITCGIIAGIRSVMLPPNHPSNVKFRKQRWLEDHPDERHKCPYK